MPSGRRRPFAGSGATCWLAEVRCNALQWRMRRRWRRRWGRRRWRRSRGGGGRAGAGGDNPPFCPSVPPPPHYRPPGAPIYFLIGEITNFGYRAPRVEFLGLKVRQNCGNLGYIISFYDALLYQGVPECYRAIIGRLHTH